MENNQYNNYDYNNLENTQHAQPQVPVQNGYAAYSDEFVMNDAPVAQPADPSPQGSYEWNGTSASVDGGSKKKDKKTPVALLLILCILLSTIFGGGSAFFVNKFMSDDSEGSKSSDSAKKDDEAEVPEDLVYESEQGSSELTTESIVQLAADSVVEIVTESVQTSLFFGQQYVSGAGSGVIIDAEGYIVTNNHVIEGAENISVTLRSGETYTAEFIGTDPKMDVAVIKIDAENLTVATVGDSDTLKVGQKAVAIGNPLGELGGTVTEGIISALNRDVIVGDETMCLLQTDTAINPGNSGGGLFDAQGKLIGVVVAKSTGSEIEGLGFAIPVNEAMQVVSDLREYGYVTGRVTLNMDLMDIDSLSAFVYDYPSEGCYISDIVKGSNAEKAGLEVDDLILKIDDTVIESSADVKTVLDNKSVGESIEFTVDRDGSNKTISFILEEYIP